VASSRTRARSGAVVDLPRALADHAAVPSLSSFVVLDSNRAARDAVLRWSFRTPDCGAPLVLVGPSGVGKTHLSRAGLAARCRTSAVAGTVVDDASKVVHAFLETLKTESAVELYRHRVRDRSRCSLVEHLEDLAKKEQSRNIVFDLFEPAAQGAGLIFTVTTSGPEARYSALLRHVRARFPAVDVAHVHRPSCSAARDIAQATKCRSEEHRTEHLRRVLERGPPDDEVGFKRMVVVLDRGTGPLAKHLGSCDLVVIEPTYALETADFGVRSGLLSQRALVTADAAAYLEDAVRGEFGIVGLDPFAPLAGKSARELRAVAAAISRASTELALPRRRGSWIVMLDPSERHVFRRLW
jgi:hypothetical protein